MLPVNFAMNDGAVIFRTRPDSTMAAQLPGAAVAFEVDSADFGNLIGWSVVVTGTCRPAPDELAGRMTPWVEGERGRVFRIEADAMTGRKLEQLDATTPPRIRSNHVQPLGILGRSLRRAHVEPSSSGWLAGRRRGVAADFPVRG